MQDWKNLIIKFLHQGIISFNRVTYIFCAWSGSLFPYIYVIEWQYFFVWEWKKKHTISDLVYSCKDFLRSYCIGKIYVFLVCFICINFENYFLTTISWSMCCYSKCIKYYILCVGPMAPNWYIEHCFYRIYSFIWFKFFSPKNVHSLSFKYIFLRQQSPKTIPPVTAFKLYHEYKWKPFSTRCRCQFLLRVTLHASAAFSMVIKTWCLFQTAQTWS